MSRKARNFFPEFNIRIYDKNSESDYYFFPPPKSEYFFQQHWESEYFFRKKTITPPSPFKLNGRSLTSINCVVTVRGVEDCRNLTDGRTNERTNGRTDIKCLSNGRKNFITLRDQTNKMYQSSRKICLRKSCVRYA